MSSSSSSSSSSRRQRSCLMRGRYLGKYEGQFLDGCMDGSGVYLWAEGDV